MAKRCLWLLLCAGAGCLFAGCGDRIRKPSAVELAQSMMAPTVKVWLMGLGTSLVMQTDRFYIAYLVSLDAVPAYVAAYALVSTLIVPLLRHRVRAQRG